MDKEGIGEYMKAAENKMVSARLLNEHGQYDDAVSRAYYAAFHAVQALLLCVGLKAETHSGVRQLFGLHFVQTGKIDRKYAKYLKNLKDDREDGDYGIMTMVEKEDAEAAIQEAKEIIEEIRHKVNIEKPS
ncbi:MAG: HEPN domain-containing protein [Candidatus Margulisbacteria bacterium]|nr:HEPN domain-containing protein [Candidatus Margulisiibacteriota bacterium]